MVKLDIITVHEWHARKPKSGLTTVTRSRRIIFHHTAGHLRQINNPKVESYEEACRYARDIQNFHMDGNGWTDSGHNFLVTRGGHVLQGRWLTVSAIVAHHMVLSAHCPGQNEQIGIEHEHYGNEEMTAKQKEASARLMAWIADKYDLKTVLPVDPHRKYFPTSCPANLVEDIAGIKKRAQEILKAGT